jgi:tetratricopeptide (TPR) repeat protein
MVLALRVWRPEVVVTDCPSARGDVLPADALVAEAVKEAFARAADPQAFPEHREKLGLEPWQASKLYGCWQNRDGAQVAVDLTVAGRRLEALVRDFAAPAAALLADAPPPSPGQCYYRLLASTSADASSHHDLMEGTVLPPGGVARRNGGEPRELAPEVAKAIQTRRNLEAMAQAPLSGLADPAKLLTEMGPALQGLPPDQGARAAYAVAHQFARQGQWNLAREAFLLMVDRYPAHPLAADAYRWLIRYNSSSEARRRYELGKFLLLTRTEFPPLPKDDTAAQKPATSGSAQSQAQIQQVRQLSMLGSREETRRWYEGCLEFEPRLAAFGPLFASDPSVQFCLQAAHRKLGDFDGAKKWYARFAAEHPSGPWKELAETELWLTKPAGQPPRPMISCRRTDTRPFLDGKLDEDCWTAHKPLVLRNAVGDTVKEYPTEVWLAHDKDFLYLALRCRHPADRHVEPVKVRPRDADVRPYDRVSLLLDLDRDYATYFQLQIDQRGCVCDDCWGDLSWDPRWFVAMHSEPDCWQVEAAIPMIELTGDIVTVGNAWACNVVRILPGRGVQACSVPADVQPRPEGMGLLMFTQDVQPPAVAERPAAPMAKVP